MTPWETILVAFGGNAVLLMVLAWLARSLMGQALAKDLESFKTNLSAESSASTARLTHDLQLVAQEHQILASKLHEKRAQVVADVYGLLVEAQWACQDFASVMEFSGEPPKTEKYVTAMNKAAEFYRYFDKNRIYLPHDLCSKLEEFMKTMRRNVIGFGVYARMDDKNLNETMQTKKYEAWDKASQYFDKEAPDARAALERELRIIIGPVPKIHTNA